MRLSRRGWPLLLTPLLLVQPAGAQAPATPQAGATFRAGVDLVRVGVQVYDKNHHVVRGLTAKDFDVRVDDATQTIAAFSEIDAPPPAADGAAAWTRDAAPDVASNEGADRESRLWAIIMDDCSTSDDLTIAVPFMVPNAKAIGHAVVDAMSPGDRAAVIFSFKGQDAQDFTSSRAKLHAAIDTFTSSPVTAVCRSQNTIQSVATFLQELANPRAAIVYIGLPPMSGTQTTLPTIPLLTRTPFYGFDVAGILAAPGFTGPGPGSRIFRQQMNLAADARKRYEFLRSLTDAFGGIAMPDTNDATRELPRMFADLDTLYVLGYQPTYPPGDGRYRRLRILVKRPGLSVEPSYRMFKTEKALDVSKPDAAGASLTKALAGVLPDGDAALQANVLPIAAGVKGEPGVAIVLGARVPASTSASTQSLDILGMIFDGEGRNKISSQTSHAEVPGGPTQRAYDFLSLRPLKPGRYNLRFALQDHAAQTVGSVYADVTVPDFVKEPLSLSGLVISATPAPPAAPKDAIARVLPVVPTTKREFATSDRVSAFLRIFQGGKSAIVPVAVRVEIEDEQGHMISSHDETIDASRFGDGRSIDWQAAIAIAALHPGRYLYTVTVTAGKRIAARDAMFRIE